MNLAQEAVQEALMSQFTQLKSRNSSYSMRAYARRLGVNSGVLSSILNGRRRISAEYARRLLDKMQLPPEEAEKLDALLGLDQVWKQTSVHSKNIPQLKSDQFHMIADGVHYSILCLMETADFKPDIEWMADRLGQSSQKIDQAVTRLERLGLITRVKNVWRPTQAQLTTSDGISDSAIKRYHEERLDEAKEKLHSIAVEDRDFFSSTFSVRRDQLPLARKLIRELKRKIHQVLEQDPKEEVYRFNVQLYPVTRLKHKKQKASEGKKQ